jgi:hypothetical protein
VGPGQLPSGTVTLLFTDIEGSTRILQQLGERYGEALLEHRRLLREAFQHHGDDHLFSPGNPENKAFWIRSQPNHGALVNRFVVVAD